LVFPDTLTEGGGGEGVTDGVAVELGREVTDAVTVRNGVSVLAATVSSTVA
jgi:hypothetical protein